MGDPADGLGWEQLAALVAPLGPEQFLADHWPAVAFHRHGGHTAPAPAMRRLLELPCWDEVAAFVEAPRRGFLRVDPLDEQHPPYPEAEPQRAVAAYEAGATLYQTLLQAPALRRWCRFLDGALGVPPGTTVANAFASPAGRGHDWHWDAQELFIVVMRGCKRWRWAPPRLSWPACNGAPTLAASERLRAQLGGPVVDPPQQWSELELVAGDVVFMPRGTWHQVHNERPSMHLALQVSTPTPRDALARALEHDPSLVDLRWRGPLVGLAEPDGFQAATDRMAALLRRLAEHVERGGLAAAFPSLREVLEVEVEDDPG